MHSAVRQYRRKLWAGAGQRWRGASAGSCPPPVYGPTEIQKCVMLNGIQIVAGRVSGALLTACTVMFQAGSRFETKDNLGATHFMRAMSAGSGRAHSAFGKLRALQQRGAYLTCTSDRQTVAFTLTCPLPEFGALKSYLVDTAARCQYHEWEIADQRQLVRGDLERVPPAARALDGVQRASWAGPLANSVFCARARVDAVRGDQLASFAAAHCTTSRCAVASVGLPFEETVRLAEMIDSRVERPPCEESCAVPQFRAGIETFDLGPHSETWIAAAVRGCGTHDADELVRHALVAAACGSGSAVQGQHRLDRSAERPTGTLAQADLFADYRAFNISYAETGIFGILARCKADMACHAACIATDFLANVCQLNTRHVEDGRKRLQSRLCVHDEDSARASHGLALQALSGGALADSAQDAVCALDAVRADDVLDTARALAARRNQMAIAIVGDVRAVPTDMFYNM